MTQDGPEETARPDPADASAPEPPAAPTGPTGPTEPAEAPDGTDVGSPAGPEEDDDSALVRQELAEMTAHLQRLQAEYLNYKRRVERDRELVRENATYAALTPIIEVLDSIDRARDHGPLEGGFKAVAEQLERVVSDVGLTKYGAPGDAFDPSLHDALSHIGEDPDVEVTTCKVVAKAGYRIGDRVVRAAQVLVVDPAAGSAGSAGTPGDDSGD